MDGIKAQTDLALKQFNQQFETSKSELINRFLRDQDELNRKFEEYALNDSDDSGHASKHSQPKHSGRRKKGEGILTLQDLDSDAESNSSLDSVVTNPDFSDPEQEEAPKQQGIYKPEAAPKQFLASPKQIEPRRDNFVRRLPVQPDVAVKHLPFEKSTTSKPWLNRARGNPHRRLPQTPVIDDKPKPWSLKARNSTKDGYRENTDAPISKPPTAHRHEPTAGKSNSYYGDQSTPNERQSKLKSNALGRSKSLRYPERSGAYTPTSQLIEESKPQLERQADSGFEERSHGGSMRLPNERGKKLLVKRSVRPLTAVGLRNHERISAGESSQGKFIDTDQSRSAPAATRNRKLVSNANESRTGEIHRSNSIRSESGVGRRSMSSSSAHSHYVTAADIAQYPKPPSSASSKSSRRSRSAVATEETTMSLLHRTRSTDLLNAGLVTPEMNRKYRNKQALQEQAQDSSMDTYYIEEAPLRKAVSCGNFPIPQSGKVTVLKLPQISPLNASSKRQKQKVRDRSGTSLGYYVTHEAVV